MLAVFNVGGRIMRENKLWKLFISILISSAFTFGGGVVIVSLYRKTFVEELNWIDEDEMMDIIAIAQSNPGSFSVNTSVALGYRIHGILGSLVALFGVIIPPFVIISMISTFYNEFRENRVIGVALQVMRAGVAAIILDIVVDLGKGIIETKNALYIIIMVLGFILKYFFNIEAMYIILFCLGVGLLTLFLEHKKGDD